MAEFYNAETLLEFVKQNTPHIGGETTMECVERAIKEAPTADVVEVKHGYWEDKYNNKYANHLYVCSVCGKEALYECYKNELDQWNERQALTHGCPHCLAIMDGKTHEKRTKNTRKRTAGAIHSYSL